MKNPYLDLLSSIYLATWAKIYQNIFQPNNRLECLPIHRLKGNCPGKVQNFFASPTTRILCSRSIIIMSGTLASLQGIPRPASPSPKCASIWKLSNTGSIVWQVCCMKRPTRPDSLPTKMRSGLPGFTD